MQHAQLVQEEARETSSKPDLNDGECLDEAAVHGLLERADTPTTRFDVISGIGYAIVIGASLWVFMLTVVALIR